MLLENSLKRGLLKSYPSIYYIQKYSITNIILLQIFLLLFENIKLLRWYKREVFSSNQLIY